MICKKALYPLPLGKWLPVLARVWVKLSWTLLSSHGIIYHVITLCSQKGASPVSQRQWSSNLVGFWVRVMVSHLLFQVACQLRDHVLSEKGHISTDARPHKSVGDTKHKKLTNQKFSYYSKNISISLILIYTTLKVHSRIWDNFWQLKAL